MYVTYKDNAMSADSILLYLQFPFTFIILKNFIIFSDLPCMFVFIVTCDDLPVISNGEVSYTPPHSVLPNLPSDKRYTGTRATYNCLSGYQLVGGTSLRACGANGEWNGTASSCGKYCQWSHVSTCTVKPV